MNHLKMLCIAALALAAAMAFASPAFATFATSPAGTTYTGTLAGSGSATFHNSVGTISCNAEVEGAIESHGPSVTGKGKATKWQYINCSNGTIESLATGTIEIHSAGKGVGTITSSGTQARALMFGIECIYQTESTDLGVVTDSSITKGTATLDLSATILRTGGSFFCGSTATLTGVALVTTPDQIFID
jgi:hypothetical protein